MNLFRRLCIFLISKFTKWLYRAETINEKCYVSVCNSINKRTFPIIILYKSRNCELCQEIETFLKTYSIPYMEVKCKQYIPLRVSKDPNLQGYFGYRVKFNKLVRQIFIPPVFPQLDCVNKNGEWEKIVGDTNQMRKKLENFISQNIESFPGFESGIYGNKSPGEQVAEQLGKILKDNHSKS